MCTLQTYLSHNRRGTSIMDFEYCLLVMEDETLKRAKSSQEEHSKSDLINPRFLHSSGLRDCPEQRCNSWNCKIVKTEKGVELMALKS